MAFIRNVDKLIEGLENKFFTEQRAKDALAPELAAEEAAREAGDSAEAAARQSADNALSGRLDVIEGSGEGSVAKAEQDAKDYADQKVAALVNSAPEVLDTLKELSDALGSDPNFATTVSNNIGAVDAKVDQEILDRQSAVSAEQFARESADSALSGRLDSLEADPTTKTYVDGEVLDLQGQITQEISDRQAAVEAEEDARQLADSNLSDRISVLEQDPTTKAYVDGEILDLQGQLTQEISDRQADVDAEETRAMSAESALSNRLDGLEQDPTTKAYVDSKVEMLEGEVSDEESRAMLAEQGLQSDIDAEEVRAMAAESALDVRIDVLEQDPTTKTYVDGVKYNLQGQINQEKDDRQAGDNALDGRLDVLEADPVTKSYVDSQDSGLQGQIDTEKGRIDAILSASEADKDSFAEIVQLINSVDTENDSAFASYVLSNDAALAQEVSDREAAVSAEQSRAEAAEAALQSDLSDEETARIAADALKVDVTPNYDIRPSVYNIGSKSANFAINLANGPMQKVTLSASVTVTFQNPVAGGNYLIEVIQDATGSRQITWPTVQWFNDTPPVLSGSEKIDFIQLFYDGSNYYGSYQLADVTFAKSSELNSSVSSLQASISAEEAARIAEDLTMFKKDGSRNMTGNILFNSDGGGNIGASAANRPNNVYAKNSVVANILISNNGFTNYGGLTVKYTQKATNYTATLTDHIIAVSDLSVSRVITLPSTWSGVVYIIKDQTGAASETNYIQISPPSGKFIDGQSDYKIKAPYESVMLVTDGTNWFII